MPYLLAIALGPVQDFIAASRKARDLWFGSDLLSRVAREAAASLHADGATLIFPTKDALTAPMAVANKLLAVVGPMAAGTPRDLAARARDRAERLLLAEWSVDDDRPESVPNASRLRNRLTEDPNAITFIDELLLRSQLGQFLEWYAAWAPYDSPGAYKERRAEVERLLAGRKALRDFRPAATVAGQPASSLNGRPKSSLDPSRESVVWTDEIAELAKHDPERASRVRRRLRLKGAEQLDGISLVKRLGGERDKRLVSVSRVAIDPFLRRAKQEGKDDALRVLRAEASTLTDCGLAQDFSPSDPELVQFKDFPYDCQLFYAADVRAAERMAEGVPTILRDSDHKPLAEKEEAAAKAFIAQVRQLKASPPDGLGLGELPAYLAVLVADGDRMGKALGTLDTPDLHQTFSRQLADFARQAGRVVRTHHGAMIYSGGDDVLAFLPLDTVLPCAFALRRVFAATMDDALPKDARKPTLSVGVAIGHYAEHLQNLLQWGRDAERAAKKPRNALAVALHTRTAGAAATLVVHRWAERGKPWTREADPVVARWWEAIELHTSEALPDSAVYDLDRLARELSDRPGAREYGRSPLTTEQVTDLIVYEAPRILKRKRGERGARALTAEEIQALVDRAGGTLKGLRRLVDELLIARRLARAVTLAGQTALDRWTDPEEGPGVKPKELPAPSTEQGADAA